MRLVKSNSPRTYEWDTTPMIDMTFQLIIFFMLTLNFSEAAQDQRVNLPASELARPPDVPYLHPLTVQLTKDNRILFGGEELPWDQLRAALQRENQLIRAYRDKKVSDTTVIIRADATSKTGEVQQIIEICQAAGFEKFALRGRQSDNSNAGGSP